MNPHLMQAVAETRREDSLRGLRGAQRAAGLREHPGSAARLIRAILSSNERQRSAAERPQVGPVEVDA